MKRIATGLSVIALAGILTGCAAAEAKEPKPEGVVIRVLAGQSTSDAGIEDMIDEWMLERFPGVTLEWECVDWGNGFSSQMRGRFASGDIPDIMIGKAQDVSTYAATGNLGPIPESCNARIRKDALDAVTVDGEVYGMPYNAWYQGVIYNKDIFRRLGLEPPGTTDELRAVVAALEEEGIVPFASHFQESWKVANMTMQYMTNEIFCNVPDWGDQFRAGKLNFSDNEMVIACLNNNQYILNASWEDALQIDQFESDSRFTQGEAAMYLTGSWSMQFASQYGEDICFGIFPFPNTTGDAKLIRETNMTFMKSADTPCGKLIDEILYALITDEELMQEILAFTQSSSVVDGVIPDYDSKIQEDIDWYEQNRQVIDVTTGNAQLTWSFQNAFAAEQLSWLKKEKTLDEVLDFADKKRASSAYGDER